MNNAGTIETNLFGSSRKNAPNSEINSPALGKSLRKCSLGSRKASRKPERNLLILIEDSDLYREILLLTVRKLYPGYQVECVDSWMRAVPKLKAASLVIIDWFLHDGVTALDCGALGLLKKYSIPHFIWTNHDYLEVPGTEVVSKGDFERLNTALAARLKEATES